MGDTGIRFRARRALLLLAPAALAVRFLPAQVSTSVPAPQHGAPPGDEPQDVRLPNGKLQRDEALKADYAKNVKDARGLIELAKSFEEDLEKDDRYVLSMSSLKKLDEMDKVIRRIRDRLKHF